MYSQLIPIRVHSFLPSQHILEVLSKIRLFWTSADSCAALSESQQGQLDRDSLVSHHPESCTRGFWGWPCVLCQLWNVSLLTAFNFCLQRDKSKWGEKHSDSLSCWLWGLPHDWELLQRVSKPNSCGWALLACCFLTLVFRIWALLLLWAAVQAL